MHCFKIHGYFVNFIKHLHTCRHEMVLTSSQCLIIIKLINIKRLLHVKYQPAQ